MLGEIPDFQQFIDNPELLDQSPFMKAAQFDCMDINGRTIYQLSSAIGEMNKTAQNKYYLPQLRVALIAGSVVQIALKAIILIDLVVNICWKRHIKPLESFNVRIKILNASIVAHFVCIISRLAFLALQKKALRNSQSAWQSTYSKEIKLLKEYQQDIHKLNQFLSIAEYLFNHMSTVGPDKRKENAKTCLEKIKRIRIHFQGQHEIYQTVLKTKGENYQKLRNLIEN